MNIAVLGAQWGDEGKGKIIDLLTPNFSIVARYQGGHNAGHTVYANGRKFILRLLPSGILHSGVTCVIGNGLVVDPQALFAEIDEIGAAGVDVTGRLAISSKAHLILPYHKELDVLAEAKRGERKIGTTNRGIGPAYEDKIGRRGIRVGDLSDRAPRQMLEDAVRQNVEARNHLIASAHMDWRQVLDELDRVWIRLAPFVTDVSVLLHQAMRDGRRIMFEGAQGTLLDIDHGTYPFVTSSSATSGGICTGLGVGPKTIGAILGVAKAYTTRVGEGPFPSELLDQMGQRLRDGGSEYGSVTGRPRRCGWFDAVALRYAVRVNGLDALAITKMDVLDGLESLEICTSYRVDGEPLHDFPSEIGHLARCQPVYERVPGWSAPTAGVRSFDALPAEARAYIATLEQAIGIPVALISTGSDRHDTILRDDAVAATWFALPA
ncbi:MAG: adenylosuccinate synthase [Luteitalea sp.]